MVMVGGMGSDARRVLGGFGCLKVGAWSPPCPDTSPFFAVCVPPCCVLLLAFSLPLLEPGTTLPACPVVAPLHAINEKKDNSSSLKSLCSSRSEGEKGAEGTGLVPPHA